MLVTRAFEPVYDARSRALVLGTMPSPASIENGFYYSHPRNRFWPVIAAVFGEAPPALPDEKRAFLLRRRIALWDVLRACEIKGASDASIRAPEPNDIDALLRRAPITHIYTTGNAASGLFERLAAGARLSAAVHVRLPSTSPANARASLSELIEAYAVIRRNMEG